MTATALITLLQECVALHGDHPVISDANDGTMFLPIENVTCWGNNFQLSCYPITAPTSQAQGIEGAEIQWTPDPEAPPPWVDSDPEPPGGYGIPQWEAWNERRQAIRDRLRNITCDPLAIHDVAGTGDVELRLPPALQDEETRLQSRILDQFMEREAERIGRSFDDEYHHSGAGTFHHNMGQTIESVQYERATRFIEERPEPQASNWEGRVHWSNLAAETSERPTTQENLREIYRRLMADGGGDPNSPAFITSPNVLVDENNLPALPDPPTL